MTLNDLERQNRKFYKYFWRFRAATNHSQGGATELSLPVCDPNREFGICILTWREHSNFPLNY